MVEQPTRPSANRSEAPDPSAATQRHAGFHDEALESMPTLEVVNGALLDQKVEVIVNAWNRNR